MRAIIVIYVKGIFGLKITVKFLISHVNLDTSFNLDINVYRNIIFIVHCLRICWVVGQLRFKFLNIIIISKANINGSWQESNLLHFAGTSNKGQFQILYNANG